MSVDPLEQRLTRLELKTPDPGRTSARVLALRRRRGGRRLIRIPALGLAAAAFAVAILYFVPVADAALAGVPVGGDLLREAGLAGAAGRVTSVGAIANSSGVKLTLVGAYADGVRTVLLLSAAPSITPGDASLTDQFGRTYSMQSGYADGRTGDLIFQFDPLGWPDSMVGARLTLRVNHVSLFFYDASKGDWTVGPPIAGAWALSAGLAVDDAAGIPAPSPGRVGGVTVTFANAHASPATIVIDVDLRGVTPEDLGRRIPDGGKGQAIFGVFISAPDGEVVTQSYGLDPSRDGTVVHLVAFRTIGGNYSLRVVYQGDALVRILRVP